MTVDPTIVGNVAADLMETIDTKYDDDANIKSVILLVSVEHSDGHMTSIEYGVSDGVAVHVGVGMLEQIKYHLLNKP